MLEVKKPEQKVENHEVKLEKKTEQKVDKKPEIKLDKQHDSITQQKPFKIEEKPIS